MLNAFTIDVEDYFQVTAFERHIGREAWAGFESRVALGTYRLLDLLARHNTLATFYVLGWVAERFPELVRDIQSAGHEIGSHSYWHRLVYELSPDEFRDDLVLSLRAIEDATGQTVTNYRAPSFSITRRSLWALDILAEHGIACDSSIFPIHHDRYGIPNARPHIHRFDTASGSLWEFPPSVSRVGRVNLPVSGGGYFRLYPLSFTVSCLRQINRAGRPFMFYIHPWELDPVTASG
jgi:polysaccharide deacetylase family protein (PEP-CTERM system associated)